MCLCFLWLCNERQLFPYQHDPVGVRSADCACCDVSTAFLYCTHYLHLPEISCLRVYKNLQIQHKKALLDGSLYIKSSYLFMCLFTNLWFCKFIGYLLIYFLLAADKI
jgi:hypothetical protein